METTLSLKTKYEMASGVECCRQIEQIQIRDLATVCYKEQVVLNLRQFSLSNAVLTFSVKLWSHRLNLKSDHHQWTVVIKKPSGHRVI